MSFYEIFSNRKKNIKRGRSSTSDPSGSNSSFIDNMKSRVYGLVPSISKWFSSKDQVDHSDSSDEDESPPSKRKRVSSYIDSAASLISETNIRDSDHNNDTILFRSIQPGQLERREERSTVSKVVQSTPYLSPVYEETAEESSISMASHDTVDEDITYKDPYIASSSGQSETTIRKSIFETDVKQKEEEKPLKQSAITAEIIELPKAASPRFRPSLYSSPFYPGPTMYGGASAYTYSNRPIIKPKIVTAPKSPKDDSSALSVSTKRFLDLLENHQSPLLEARRISVIQKQNQTYNLNKNQSDPTTSRLEPYKTRELNIASPVALLRFKQQSRFMNADRLERQKMASHSSTQPGWFNYKDTYKLPEKDNSGKIKTCLTRTNRGEDYFSLPEPVQLPTAVLQIDKNNLPKFSMTYPLSASFKPLESAVDCNKSPTTSLEKASAMFADAKNNVRSVSSMFKFTSPVPVTQDSNIIDLVSSFSSSCEQTANEPRDTNSVCAPAIPTAPLLAPSVPTNDIKLEEKDWKCDDCWITNKSRVDKCAACGASKPGAKKHADPEPQVPSGAPPPPPKLDDKLASIVRAQKASKWECSCCLTSNDNNKGRCQCCDMEREGPSKEITPKPFKFPKESNITFKFGIDPKEQEENIAKKSNELSFGVKTKLKEAETNNNTYAAELPYFAKAEVKKLDEKKNDHKEISMWPTKITFSTSATSAPHSPPKQPISSPLKQPNVFSPSHMSPPKAVQDEVPRSLSTQLPTFQQMSTAKITEPVQSETVVHSVSSDNSIAKKMTVTKTAPTGLLEKAKAFSFGAPSTGINGGLFSSNPSSGAGGFSFGAAQAAVPSTKTAVPPLFSSPEPRLAHDSSNNLFTTSQPAPSAASSAALETVTAQLFGFGGKNTSTTSTIANFTFGTSNKEASSFGENTNKNASVFRTPNAFSMSATSAVPEASSGSSSFGAGGNTAFSFGATAGAFVNAGATATPADKTAAPLFGAQPTDSAASPLFGVQPATPNVFAPASTGTVNQQISLFASAPQPAPMFGSQPSTSIFSASNQPPAYGVPTQTQPSVFGVPVQAQSSVFGASAQNQTPAFGVPSQSQSSTFGSPAQNQTPAFGAPSQNQLQSFGASVQNQSPAFGSPIPSQAAFGVATQNQTPAFGVGTQNQSPAFGVIVQPVVTSEPMFNFGSQSTTPQGIFGFGQQQQQQLQQQQQQQPPQPQPQPAAAFSFAGGNAMVSLNSTMGGLNSPMGGMMSQLMEPAMGGVQFNVGSAPMQRRIRKAVRRTQR